MLVLIPVYIFIVCESLLIFQMTELKEKVLNINMSLHEIIKTRLDVSMQTETGSFYSIGRITLNGCYEV
jgi:hypothetical protein